MSRRKIGEALRQRLLQRAGHRCEYCQSHEDLLGDELQIDHIIPLVKGGTNDERNLCVACSRCNRNKGIQVSGIDPETGQVVPLFNPRRQKWERHFRWSKDGTRIIGLTSCGRATVEALKLNDPKWVKLRRLWVLLGKHPPKPKTTANSE